jgi:hypothetical protein
MHVYVGFDVFVAATFKWPLFLFRFLLFFLRVNFPLSS